MIVDMHCHLDLYPDPFLVANQCVKKGIYVLSVTTTPKAWLGTKKLESENGRIRTALGLHPQLAHLRMKELELFDSLLPNAKYVGEIGLDGSSEYKNHFKSQLNVLRHILTSVQKEGGRIMSIHSRASTSNVLDELKDHPHAGLPILHWFTGNEQELKRAIDLGCWFSVGPAMISSKKGRLLISKIPINRIITETDGPFAKVKGKILMPWDAETVAPQLAKIWDVDFIEAKNIIKENFRSLMFYPTPFL